MSGYVDPGYVLHGYFGQPASLCAFTLGSESLQFDQPYQRPGQTLALVQASAQNTGGDTFGYQVFASDRTLTLVWPRMLTYYLERLRDWFKRVAKGMAETFVFTLVDGSQVNVRFASPEIKSNEVAPDRHRVEISLWVMS